MSLLSNLTHMWSQKPTQAQLSAVEELHQKSIDLIKFIEEQLPHDADSQAAINAVNEAVMHSQAAMGKLAKKEASDASNAEAASKAEAAGQAT